MLMAYILGHLSGKTGMSLAPAPAARNRTPYDCMYSSSYVLRGTNLVGGWVGVSSSDSTAAPDMPCPAIHVRVKTRAQHRCCPGWPSSSAEATGRAFSGSQTGRTGDPRGRQM